MLENLLRRILSPWMTRKLLNLKNRLAHRERISSRRSLLKSGVLRHCYPGLSEGNKTPSIHKFEIQVFSQHGEDGLILRILSKLVSTRKFVEIGVEDGQECNTALLSTHFGWSGLQIEIDAAMAKSAQRFYDRNAAGRVKVLCAAAKPNSIDRVIQEHGYSGEIDLLSIDIDSYDYWIWDAIRGISPRLVVMEYNANFGPNEALTIPYSERPFNRFEQHPSGKYEGASLKALQLLAEQKGYDLVACESSATNAFFTRKDLTEKAGLTGRSAQEAFIQPKDPIDVDQFRKSIEHLPLVNLFGPAKERP